MNNEEIKALIDKKTELEKRKERLLGKMESAKNALSEIDQKLLSMNINPKNLADEIQRLENLREQMLEQLNFEVTEGELALNKIEQRVKEISQ
jgi:chromosome segregation ATPase